MFMAPDAADSGRLVPELVDGRRPSCTGSGAGNAATAQSIVADLYDLAALPRRPASAVPAFRILTAC